MTDNDALLDWKIRVGIPLRPFVPVLSWKGSDNGIPQEYGMILRFFTKGEHVSSERPAGTMGHA